MPKIEVNVTDKSSGNPAVVSSKSTVLVPVIFGSTTESSETVKPSTANILFTSYSEWSEKNETSAFTNTIQMIGTATASVRDLSWNEIGELLYMGYNVLMKPVINKEGTEVKPADNPITESAAVTLLATKNTYDEFKNRNIYKLRFLTTGAHANAGYVESSGSYSITGAITELESVADARGDCIALVDFVDGTTVGNLTSISVASGTYSKEGFTYPWCQFKSYTGSSSLTLPGSFGYLSAYANSTLTNPKWVAAAGVVRGIIPNLIAPNVFITESEMHTLQNEAGATDKISVNPIMQMNDYGIVVWGNKTFKPAKSGTFSSFLNVQLLVCDICEAIYNSAVANSFEPNDSTTWINFISKVNTVLETMRSGRGLSNYYWTKLESTKLGTIKGKLTIRPIEAVENFEISVVLTEDGAETSATEEV